MAIRRIRKHLKARADRIKKKKAERKAKKARGYRKPTYEEQLNEALGIVPKKTSKRRRRKK